MPRGDGTGPAGRGRRDGSGRQFGGRGQGTWSKRKGSGAKTGGRKGKCR